MPTLHFPHHFYPILFALVLISSCSGQDKTKGLSEGVTQDKPERPWVDELMYIDGQLCQHLRTIFEDSKGNLWFGTNNYDIMRYDGDSLVYFGEKDGFASGRLTGIAEDKEGTIWFGTSAALTKYDGTSFTNYSEREGPFGNEIWSLMIDKKGLIWLGTNDGVRTFDGTSFSSFSIPKGVVQDTTTIYGYDRITSIMEDSKGIFWIGTDGFGLCKYDPTAEKRGSGKTFTVLTKEDGLPDNNISGFIEDHHGNIWMSSMFGGVSKYDGKTYHNFTLDGELEGIEAGAFFEDSKGDMWFAVENVGVYRYDGKSFEKKNEADGLNTNGVLAIYEDTKGRFWFGGWGGLFRFDGQKFVSVTKDGPWD